MPLPDESLWSPFFELENWHEDMVLTDKIFLTDHTSIEWIQRFSFQEEVFTLSKSARYPDVSIFTIEGEVSSFVEIYRPGSTDPGSNVFCSIFKFIHNNVFIELCCITHVFGFVSPGIFDPEFFRHI